MSKEYKKRNQNVTSEIKDAYLTALFNFFVTGLYLDLNTKTYVTLGQEEDSSKDYALENDWLNVDKFVKKYINPQDQALLTEVSKIEYIREHLKNEENYSVEIRTQGFENEKWFRFTVMRGADEDHAAISFVDITDRVKQNQELEKLYEHQNRLNSELESKSAELAEANAEQEAQLEEIKALNSQLEDNQAELEAASAEQEAQLDEINKLNGELQNQLQFAKEAAENQKQLNHTLSEYSRIMSSAGFGMWHIILKDGAEPRMQGNDKMRELMGVAGKELSEEELYHAWYDRIVPEEIPSVNASVAEMMEGKFSENTYLWNHPVLGNIYVRCGGTCQKMEDGTNVLGGYHANVTDIVLKDKQKEEELEKAQKAAEEERASVSKAYGIIEGFSHEYHTIWLINKDTLKMQLIRSNGKSTVKKAVQMGIDYPDFDTAFNQYIETCIEPIDRERMHKEIAAQEVLRQLEENPDKIYAVNYLRRDESEHVGYHQIAFANADTQTGIKQFVLGFRDIDTIVKAEQKQKEELEKAKEAAESANQAKTAFLFNMSHDIRTPMNAIMGFRDLLEKNQENPEKRQDYLNKIRDASTVLLSIINNVLEMARIEKGAIEIDETAWSAEQFNDTLYSVFYEIMKEKGLNFTRQIDVEHHYVYCDPIKLREIFINILSNAYKYTHSGSVTMVLKEIPSTKEGWAFYQTTISDTGIGMDESFLPHLFEEFSREKNTTEAKIEGTGLGMPIVKRLVDMLDGTIEVKSKKGEGSTFIVTIPHRIADKSKLIHKAGIEIDPNLFKGKRILLAEDNDLNAEIAEAILEEAGFVVERADDGDVCVEMLKKAEAKYYDVILMDIQMPEMNGYEATKAIRTLNNSEKANIKIIAMTANAFEEDKREALRVGMNGHVAKPINVNELMRTLAGILG